MKTARIIAIIVILLTALWAFGVINISTIDPIEVAKKNEFYIVEGCETPSEDLKFICSEASCKNTLIARGYAAPRTVFQAVSHESMQGVESGFIHVFKFNTGSTEMKVFCKVVNQDVISIDIDDD
ncbi:MAG: hypothetical protein JAY97_16165 [Candidatus Thiodiazotropha sp. 'RUGA']|nr:hypothetical protein [Candidatus Thiodiazotropha sp. 'RUGA']